MPEGPPSCFCRLIKVLIPVGVPMRSLEKPATIAARVSDSVCKNTLPTGVIFSPGAKALYSAPSWKRDDTRAVRVVRTRGRSADVLTNRCEN